MKKTLNVNIGSVAFTIDEDAYYTLSGYYDDIRSRLYEQDRQEVMDDIESRTADIFRENLTFSAQAVNIDLVKKAMAIIGPASTFGDKHYDSDYTPPREEGKPSRRLFRSRRYSIIGGVCGGLAEYLNADVSLVRVLAALLMFITGGTGLLVYLVMWIIIPLEPRSDKQSDYNGKRRSRK